MEGKALKYLEQNSLFHMGMIFPIRRGSAEIFYAEDDGVFIQDRVSGAFMLSFYGLDRGMEFLDSIGRVELICLYQKELADYFQKKHNYDKYTENFQAVYMKKEPVKVSVEGLEIRTLDARSLDLIYEHYHYHVSRDYLKRRLEDGAIYGGFADGELCGFAGVHEEGAVGILKVLDKFRRRGFAEALEAHVINAVLANGEVPFVQVSPDNDASIGLQRKLGLEVSRERLYWLFD